MRITVCGALLVLAGVLPALGQMASCGGEERWAVKTLADPGASKIATESATTTTVANLVGLARPGTVDGSLPRTGGTESTKFTVSALLTLYKEEEDHDYHLVLEDGQDHTMIAEIPDPKCVDPSSPVLAEITRARQEFDSRFRVSADKHATKIPVTVTGFGFFDIVHGGAGQLGHADNNIEIHPVLDIQFSGAAPPEFETPSATITAADVKTAVYTPGIGMMWWVIAVAMTIFYIVAIRETVGTLRRSDKWSLAEALQDVDTKPSSSRLIAFLGLLILMVLYMGIGYVAIWRLLNNQELPNVNTFLLTGLSLFAPYAFNQLRQMVGGINSSFGSGAPAGGGAKSAPKVMGVAPGSVSANTSTQITVTGLGFDAKANVLVTTSAAPVTPSSLLVTATQIQFAATMPSSGAPYVAVVHIVNPDGAEATGSFQVS